MTNTTTGGTAAPTAPQPAPADAGVFRGIWAIMAEFSREGLAKGRQNTTQGYNFRGIDDVMNALSGKLVEHRLVILPRATVKEMTHHETRKANGATGVQHHAVVEVEYTFRSLDDGSTYAVTVTGEGLDSGDKAVNKASSAAYKYMALQVFCIPVEGMTDADADSPTIERESRPAPQQRQQPPRQAPETRQRAPERPNQRETQQRRTNPTPQRQNAPSGQSRPSRRMGARQLAELIVNARSLEDLKAWRRNHEAEAMQCKPEAVARLQELFAKRWAELEAGTRGNGLGLGAGGTGGVLDSLRAGTTLPRQRPTPENAPGLPFPVPAASEAQLKLLRKLVADLEGVADFDGLQRWKDHVLTYPDSEVPLCAMDGLEALANDKEERLIMAERA